MKLLVSSLFVASIALAQGGPPPELQISPREREALVAGVFDRLRTPYVFPDKVQAGISELTRRWSTPAFAKLTRSSALLGQMHNDLYAEFKDKHLSVSLSESLPPGFYNDPDQPDPKMLEQQAAFERLTHYGVMRVEILPGNIGLLRVAGFAGLSPGVKQAYADAMGFVRDTDALLVDVRDNGGGDGESVAEPRLAEVRAAK
jgi:retinol-binding protein 3